MDLLRLEPRRTPQIWRIPAEGGQAVQITQGGAVYAEVSWDDTHLYFARDDRSVNAVWRTPVGGGEETEVVQGAIHYYTNWAASRTGIYYVTQQAPVLGGVDHSYEARVPTEYAIRFLDFQSGEVSELLRREGPFAHEDLAVSPDEQWILYTELPIAQAELMLVENFR